MPETKKCAPDKDDMIKAHEFQVVMEEVCDEEYHKELINTTASSLSCYGSRRYS